MKKKQILWNDDVFTKKYIKEISDHMNICNYLYNPSSLALCNSRYDSDSCDVEIEYLEDWDKEENNPLNGSIKLFDSTDSDDIALKKMIDLQKLIRKVNKND